MALSAIDASVQENRMTCSRPPAHWSLLLALLGAASAAGAQSTGVIGKDATVTAGDRPTALVFKVKRAEGDATTQAVALSYHTEAGTALAGTQFRPTSGRAIIRTDKNQILVPVEVLPQSAGAPSGGQLRLVLDHALALEGPVDTLSLSAQSSRARVDAAIWGMASADFNGDGKPDLVLAGMRQNQLQVLLNTTPSGGSTASYAAPLGLTAAISPAKPVVCDLNNDGRPDLVAGDQNTNQFTVHLNTTAPGATTASFSGAVLPSLPWGYMSQMACADFDGDGRLDLVGAGFGSPSAANTNRAIVFRNLTPAGASTVTLADAVGLPAHPTHAFSRPMTVVSADFNGDGRPDIALGHMNSHDVTVLLNTTPTGGAITFSEPKAYDVVEGPTDMAVGDFNRDGQIDIVTTNGVGDLGGVTWALVMNRTATGATQSDFRPTVRQAGGIVHGVTVADMDLDGRDDVLVTYLATGLSVDGSVGVLLNRSGQKLDSLSFLQANVEKMGLDEPHAVAVADINGDGVPDFVTADLIATRSGQQPVKTAVQSRAGQALKVLRTGTGQILP